MSSAALATINPDVSPSDEWNDQRREFIRKTYCGGAPDAIAQTFLQLCERRNLSPEERHVYLVNRKQGGRDNWVIQTGIDGYRAIADRTRLYAGSDEPVYTGDADGKPLKATVTVWKLVGGVRCPFTKSAYWDEYNAGGPMWSKMPRQMLAKCAESQALRAAFPAQLSGVYTSEEMDQAADAPAAVPSSRVQVIRHTPSPAVDRSTGEVIEVKPTDSTGGITEAQKAEIKALLDELGQPFQHGNRLSRALFGKTVVRLSMAEGYEIISRLNEEINGTSPVAQLLAATAEKLDIGEDGGEGEVRTSLYLLFPDFEGRAEEWTDAQVAHAIAWFAERDADAVQAVLDGMED